jgi:hypothetical protein
MSTEIDLAAIKEAAHKARPLTFKTYTLPHETEIYLYKVLASFLAELGQEKLKEPLSYCLRELAVNAKKANTKRVYFMEKGLDLNNDKDYETGMRTFKQETFDNIHYYLQKQKELGRALKPEEEIQALQLAIKKTREEGSPRNGGNDPKKLIDEGELERHLVDGWDVQMTLPSGKILVRKQN